MRDLLDSPRRRKRVLLLLALAVAAVVGTVLGLRYTNTAKPDKDVFEGGQAKVIREQKPTRLSAADRRAVLATVDRFVDAAVARKDLAGSYDMTTANLHGGVSRAEWARGDTPIYPYPVFEHGARIAQAFPGDVMVQLYLRGRSRKVDPLGVDMELKAVGKGSSRRWLVDYYLPRETLATADKPAPARDPNAPSRLGPHLTLRWFLVPLGILLLIILVPAGLIVRDWLAGRAAERAYGEGRQLPPLPRRSGRDV